MRELNGKRTCTKKKDQRQPVKDLINKNYFRRTPLGIWLNRQSRETMEGSNRVRWKALVEAPSSQAKYCRKKKGRERYKWKIRVSAGQKKWKCWWSTQRLREASKAESRRPLKKVAKTEEKPLHLHIGHIHKHTGYANVKWLPNMNQNRVANK